MKNITKSMFLLVSALTVGVNYTRGDKYNPDCREQLKSKILEACSKQVSDFLKEDDAFVKKGAELMCDKCVDKMTKFVEDYCAELNKNKDYVETGTISESELEKVLKENKGRLQDSCCCFAHWHTFRDCLLSPKAIIPALRLLDACNRFRKRYECEMHAMHKRMMNPKLYVKQVVDSVVLSTLIRGYKRVHRKAVLWELCHTSRPQEWNQYVGSVWDKSMCVFLQWQTDIDDEEIFDAFVGYNDNAFVGCWGRPCLFEGDWWAEVKPVKMEDFRVNWGRANHFFNEVTARDYYHSAFADCRPSKYCDEDFKQVAETMVKQCTDLDFLSSLHEKLSKERNDLDTTLIWFLDKVLAPRVGVK